MKKIIFLLFSFSLLLSLTACQSQAPTNSSPSGQSSSISDEKVTEWLWPLDETTELSIWLTWSSEYLNTPNELPAIQEIEKNTNVHVNWITAANQEAQEKFGLLLASGNYPDILRNVEAYYSGGLTQANLDGVLLDLSDTVEQNMPTYTALRQSNEKLYKDTRTDDGKTIGIYTIASDNGKIAGERVWGGLAIRQDWLDMLHLEKPVTLSDWHHVLTAFKENIPGCTAPLMIASDGVDEFHHFVSAYGILADFYYDGKQVNFGPAQKEYYEFLKTFSTWYAEGLIDPNFSANDASVITPPDYLGTGISGAGTTLWAYTADYYQTLGYTTEASYFLSGVTTPILAPEDIPQIGRATSELAKESMSITKNCKNPELAERWLDYWYTKECMLLDSYGLEGEHYIQNKNGTYSISETVKKQVADGLYPTLSTAMECVQLNNSDFGLYNWGRFDAIFEGERSLEAYDAWEKEHFDLMLPTYMSLTEKESVEFNNLYISIETLVQENTVKFITGARPLEEFEQFVSDLNQYGLKRCIELKQAALDRYLAR